MTNDRTIFGLPVVESDDMETPDPEKFVVGNLGDILGAVYAHKIWSSMMFKKKKSEPRKIYERFNEQLKRCQISGIPVLPPPMPWYGMSHQEREEYAPMLAAMRRRYERHQESLKR